MILFGIYASIENKRQKIRRWRERSKNDMKNNTQNNTEEVRISEEHKK